MSTPEKRWKYVQATRDAEGRLIAKGMLPHGLKINGVAHKEFVMREPLTGDLLDAEHESSAALAMNYNTALMAKTLERVGDFDGAITVGMLRKLKPADFAVLREAQSELDIAGEVEQ